MAVMGAIINLPWDNNNTVNDQILRVSSIQNPFGNYYECNSTNNPQDYRKGGFVGSRNCRALNDGTYNFNASSNFNDGDGLFNDIDDYGSDINASNDCAKSAGKSLYTIKPIVIYSQDPDPTAFTLQLPGDDKNITTGTSNTKRFIVKVGYNSSNNKFYNPLKQNCITAFEYHSFNLGNIQINDSQKIGGWQ